MRRGGYAERLLKALVKEYLDIPRLDKAARQEGVNDKDVIVKAGIASWSQVNGPEWAQLYRDEVRPAILELYRDGLIEVSRLGTTGIWLHKICPTKAGIRYIRLMKNP